MTLVASPDQTGKKIKVVQFTTGQEARGPSVARKRAGNSPCDPNHLSCGPTDRTDGRGESKSDLH